MFYDVSVYWNAGAVKAVNQDSVLVLQALTGRGRILLAAVCDGMGGMEQGEDASGYVTEELTAWFYDSLLTDIGKRKPIWVIRRSLERKVYQMQSRMQRYAGKRKISLGTTMSVLVLWERTYMFWHLGDSRIYQISGKVRKMTQDHVQGTNRLTRCVGSFGFFLPEYKMGIMKKQTAFLLCSDGFWHKLQEKEIGEVLCPYHVRRETGERRLKELAEAVMRRGEQDNISALYIKCSNTEK